MADRSDPRDQDDAPKKQAQGRATSASARSSPTTCSWPTSRRRRAGTTRASSPTGRSRSTPPRRCCTTPRPSSTGSRPSAARTARSGCSGPQKHIERMNNSAKRMCIPPLDPELALRSLAQLVGLDRDWVPKTVGTSLYVRPTIIASEPFLGVRPAKAYIYFVILSPVGAYYPEGMAPVKIRVDGQVRARGGRRARRGQDRRQLRGQPRTPARRPSTRASPRCCGSTACTASTSTRSAP